MEIYRILAVVFAFAVVIMQSDGFSSSINATSLDEVLRNQAFKAFFLPKTGVIYGGVVPSNLSRISISSMRLRSGSLLLRGVKDYKEFRIPAGVVVNPYVERLVLVYQNLGIWSEMYYPPPTGYTHVSSVLSLLAYDGSNLSTTRLPQLHIVASLEPILVRFRSSNHFPGSKCVRYSRNSVDISFPVSGNRCSAFGQDHFSLVVRKQAEAPSPSPSSSTWGGDGEEDSSTVWIVVGSVAGWVVGLFMLAWLIVWGLKCKERKKMEGREKAADVGDSLRMKAIGSNKAPIAMGTQTVPILENDYAP